MVEDLFTKDFKTSPYWWDTSPSRASTLETSQPDIPRTADVVVVGAGYTGLHAALAAARGGRSVVVFDAEAAGWGCSTRNGGQVSTSIKPDLEALTKRHGAAKARQIHEDGRASLEFLGNFVRKEGLKCDFNVVGRFHAAHNAASFRKLSAAAVNQAEGPEVPVQVIERAEQRTEVGTDIYHGGVIYQNHAAIDPGRYHAGLLRLAEEAGAVVIPYCPVRHMSREAAGHRLETPRGRVLARDVVIATNGYSGALSPWHRRRIIPIGSYMIATESLPEAVIDELIPRNRIVSDTRRVVYYYRASPDRRRILFGGRVSQSETDPRYSGPRLRAELVRLFPQISDAKISHSWMGFVGYTFDTLPHTGSADGIHYAMGYCGSGVGMASYLGMRTGQRILGLPDAATGIEHTAFETRPFYNGKPWFLAPAVSYYRLRDRLNL